MLFDIRLKEEKKIMDKKKRLAYLKEIDAHVVYSLFELTINVKMHTHAFSYF